MALPNWQRTVVTQAGDVVPNAEVQVVVEATGLDADIFSDRDGNNAKSNPFFTGSNGLAEFYAAPGEYRVTATGPSGTITWRYEVLLGTATDNVFTGANTYSDSVDVSGTFDVSGTVGASLTSFVNERAVPPGAVLAYASTVAPSGYLLCDGAAVSRTTYADLFTAISTTWGAGDGTTTFNLPDGRGGVLRGTGTGSVNGRDKVGPAVGDKQEDQMQRIVGSYAHGNTAYGRISGAFSQALGGQAGAVGMGSEANREGDFVFNSSNSPGARVPTEAQIADPADTETRAYSIGVQFIIKT